MSENPKRLIGAREVAEKLHIGRTKAYVLIREQMVVLVAPTPWSRSWAS